LRLAPWINEGAWFSNADHASNDYAATMNSGLSLATLSRGRDNNLNLLRFTAATAVVYAHSFGITSRTSSEIFYSIFGIGLGDIGVDAFFIVSGFLVTKSFCSKDLRHFVWARIMRIYPALWVSSLVFIAIVGLFVSPLPTLDFWSRHDTLLYLIKNATMLPAVGAETRLPFAFDATHTEFNTSLWTLPHELQMYILLSLLGIIGALRFPIVVVGLACFGGIAFVGDLFGWFHLLGIDRARFIFMFFCGASFYLLRERVRMLGVFAVTCVVALGAAAIFTSNHLLHRVVLAAVLPFLALWCGFVPGGYIRRFNRVGDYSYGVYILACPIQFYLADRYNSLSPWSLFALSMMVLIPLAIISWHYLESRALHVPLPQAVASSGAFNRKDN
jgi:peptidoglycan/LPS O-acetylase OafA/YrhL